MIYKYMLDRQIDRQRGFSLVKWNPMCFTLEEILEVVCSREFQNFALGNPVGYHRVSLGV